MFCDSHCHINSADFATDREDVVQRAREMKVEYILDVSDDIADTPKIIEFCRNHPKIYTTAGIHPEIADKYPDFCVADFAEIVKSPYVVGIGECGLDYYYSSNTKDRQINILKEHIKASQEYDLPLSIHNRDSDADIMQILSEAYKIKPFRGELHCFSSSAELCNFALQIGFYISASGIITFKKSEELRNVFATVPIDRLLIETDSPFLAPIPHRGERNEPAFVVNTAQVLAEVKGLSVDELATVTTTNFLNLFNKIKK